MRLQQKQSLKDREHEPDIHLDTNKAQVNTNMSLALLEAKRLKVCFLAAPVCLKYRE